MGSTSTALFWCLVVVVGGAGLAWAQAGAAGPQYFDRHRCGVVDAYRLAPRTLLLADFDGDGQRERYVANAGGVERHRVQPGSVPPTTVRESVVYRSSVTPQYSCVDLRAHDVDRDGDIDLIFGSPAELVVLENRQGRLRVQRRQPQQWSPEADVRLDVGPGGPRLRLH
jgi:hypothetical protein